MIKLYNIATKVYDWDIPVLSNLADKVRDWCVVNCEDLWY